MKTKILLLLLLCHLGTFAQQKTIKSSKKVKIEHISESKYLQLVKQKENVLVDFYADWCGPCKKLAPIIEKISKEKGIAILKINIDKNPELAQKLNIEGLPTLYYYINGNLQWNHLGLLTKEELSKKVN